MNYLVWMMRAKRWVQRPPSAARVKLVFGVVAICVVIAGYEWIFGWPDWLTVNRLSMKP
jgi:predicted acyltransferase